MKSGSSDRRATRLLIHPVVLVILAVAVGSVVGLEGHWGSHPSKTSPGHKASAHAKSNEVGFKGYTPTLPPPGSHLTFDATFGGSTLNTDVWNTCYWYAVAGAGCGHPGVYPEDEWYLPSQDQVSNGELNLVTSATPTVGTDAQGNQAVFPCRSGMITSDPRYDFTYGYLQVVARIPKGRNTWPALWMLPANHTTDKPEIDIMEIIGTVTNLPAMAFHPVVGNQQRIVAKTSDLSVGWHTFGLNWEPGSLTWFVDGKAVFAVTNQVPTQPMYFLADLAITNTFSSLRLPGSCTASMAIRSVKVWQKTPS